MSIKNFLIQQGFIQASENKKAIPAEDPEKQQKPAAITPTYFPSANSYSQPVEENVPSFVAPLKAQTNAFVEGSNPKDQQPDPAFVKFFEDHLTKGNQAGPDYFEFRQMLLKMQQKMSEKGISAPEVVLQAVLTNFEAQNVSSQKLAESAGYYKGVLQQAKDEFLRGAENEKKNIQQRRQETQQNRENTIKSLEQQLQQLEQKKKQLQEAINNEQTQHEADKTLGVDAIAKIERAQGAINLAHAFMQTAIESDIKNLQSH